MAKKRLTKKDGRAYVEAASAALGDHEDGAIRVLVDRYDDAMLERLHTAVMAAIKGAVILFIEELPPTTYIPPCAVSMGCLCALHARNPRSRAKCDATE